MSTLAQIRTSARNKADESSTGFIDNSELNGYLNQGYRLIYGKIAQRFENYFVQPGTSGNGGLFTTVINQQGYNLPTDLMKLVRVEYRRTNSTSDNDFRRLATLNIGNDRLYDYFPLREGYTPGFGYFIAGNKIYFKPVPQQDFQVRIWYIPRVTALSADGDTPVIPDEYHELMSEYGAIQCLAKSGEGIFRERSEAFKLELDNLIETIEIRDHQSEQMIIQDDYDFVRYGL